MKLSFTAWLSHPYFTIEDTARLANDAGYKAIEIAVNHQIEGFNEKTLKQIKTTIQEYKLEVSGFCLIFPEDFKHTSKIEKVRKQSFEYTKRVIDFAHEIPTNILVWGSGFARNIPNDVPRNKGREWLVELLRESGQYAENKEMTIAIEPLNRYESNIINTVEEAAYIAREVNSPSVKILCDTFHMNIEDASIEKTVLEANDLIFHVHVADSNRRMPGKGHFPFNTFLKSLKKINYDKYLTLECILSEDPKADLIEAKNYLHSLEP